MSVQRLLENAEALKALAIYLSKCPEVIKFDEGESKEAWELAHTFADLEESFHKFLEYHLPMLVQDQTKPSEISNILAEIGEELRHIAYHIKNTRFYQYINQDVIPDRLEDV